jgi:hypothetical protein
MRMSVLVVAAVVIAGSAGCGIIGPSCTDETGLLLNVNAAAPAGTERFFEVISPKHSNLVMRLTWADPDAELAMNSTIIDCGGHVGCSKITVGTPFGPGGSSPAPQPWPTGLREMEVDGWRGKTWRIAVTGDAARDASFTLAVSYKIACES